MVSELPETSYAVLGLVDKLPGSSGYELVAVANRSFAHFWPISQTLLYKELNRLAELGWVVASRVEQARSPTKSVYRSTPSGREALAGWLATTSQHTESFRSSFLLRFFLAHLMSARHLHALLGDYRRSLVERRDDLTDIVAGLEKASTPMARMGRLSALHGLRTVEARLQWVSEVESELGPG